MNHHTLAQEKDKNDLLAPFRDKFHHPENEIYLDGNSLGKLPLEAKELLREAVEKQWGTHLIRSWNDHWLDLPKRLARKLGHILNAKENEITVGESTSVNLYKLVQALVHSGKYGNQLITDSLNFPTDNYILEGIAQKQQLPPPLLVEYSSDLEADLDRLKNTIKEQAGIICLSLVSYKSAYLYPMQALNAWAEKHQSIVVWDLSHAVGAVAIDFKATQSLAAIGCTYKYLNGGPGAPSFLYLDAALHDAVDAPIQGWFGHARPFDFSSHYEPASDITKFDAGTPTVLSLVAMEAGINLTLAAGSEAIRTKSEALTSFFIEQAEQVLFPLGYKLETPIAPRERGSHVTLSHPESWRICQCLLHGKKDRPKIIPDFRPDRYLRFGFAPLYTTFKEVVESVERLKEIVETEEYLHYDNSRPQVT